MILQQMWQDEEQQEIRNTTLLLQEKMTILQAQLNFIQPQEHIQHPRKAKDQSKRRQMIIIDEEIDEEEEENEERSSYYDSEEEAYVECRPQKRYRDTFSSKRKLASPVSLELENAYWPLKFKLPASQPEFNGCQTQDNFCRNTQWQYLQAEEMR
jgi:hypothetical protein